MADATQIRITAVDKTTEAFRSVQGNIARMTGSLKGIAGPLAAAFSVGAIVNFSRNIMNAADRLTDLSAVTGFTVEQLSSLSNAAQLNGSSAEALQQGLVRLSKSIAEAGAGAQQQLKAFQALGISQDELRNKAPIEIFFQVADAYAAAADGAEKIAISNAIGGRSFSELIPLLNQGREAIQKYESTFTTEQAEKFAEFNDNIDKLSLNLQKMAATVLGPVISGVNSFFKSLEAGNKRLKADTEGLVGTFDMYLEDYPARVEQATNGIVEAIDTINKKFEKSPVKPKLVFGDTDEEKRITEALTARNEELIEVFKMARRPIDDYQEQLLRLTRLKQDGLITLDQYYNALERVEDAYATTLPKVELNDTALRQYIQSTKDLRGALDNAAVRGLQSLEDALLSVYTGTMSVKDAFRNMAISIINDLLRIQIQKRITGPLAAALDGFFSGTQSPAPIETRNLAGIPGRALGGTVTGSQAYMVGERGPELFIPGKTGAVVPNNQLGGSGAVVNQTINISTGVSQTVRAEVIGLMPQIMESTKAAILDAKRRGGTFGKAFA
jgi:hypothetical protein